MLFFHFFTQKRSPKTGPPKWAHHSKNSLYGGYPKKPWTDFVIFYEGQLSRSHLELSFAKITVFPYGRTDERTDIGSVKLADVIGASRKNSMDPPMELF